MEWLTQTIEMTKTFFVSYDPNVVFVRLTISLLLIFILLRYLMIGGLFRDIKTLGKVRHRRLKKEYASRLWVGWLFFVVSGAIFEGLVFFPGFFSKRLSFELWISIACGVTFLGVYLQLYMLSKSLIRFLKEY